MLAWTAYCIPAPGHIFTFLILPVVVPPQLVVWQCKEADWWIDMAGKYLNFLLCHFTVLAVLLILQYMKLGEAGMNK